MLIPFHNTASVDASPFLLLVMAFYCPLNAVGIVRT